MDKAIELLDACLRWSKIKNDSYMSYGMGLPKALENDIAEFLERTRVSNEQTTDSV